MNDPAAAFAHDVLVDLDGVNVVLRAGDLAFVVGAAMQWLLTNAQEGHPRYTRTAHALHVALNRAGHDPTTVLHTLNALETGDVC